MESHHERRNEMDGSIEIRVSNGDWAEADEADGAVCAARTMMRDAETLGASLQKLTVSFIDIATGRCIASGLRYRDLNMAVVRSAS
jgi:hypothetical protein